MSGTITLPREVVKLALDALHYAARPPARDDLYAKEIAILRTALAAEQPKPEPLAYFDGVLMFNEAAAISSAIDARKKEQSEDIEALRRDNERYRWLKAKVEDYDGHACFPEVPYPAPIPDRSPFDAVDAAIDAAMGDKT